MDSHVVEKNIKQNPKTLPGFSGSISPSLTSPNIKEGLTISIIPKKLIKVLIIVVFESFFENKMKEIILRKMGSN